LENLMHLKLKQDMQAAGINVSEGDTLQQNELQAARDFLYFRGINIGEHFENYEAAIGAEPAAEVPPQDGLVANVPLTDLDNPPSGNLTIPTADAVPTNSQVQSSEPVNQEPVSEGSESAESTDTPPADAPATDAPTPEAAPANDAPTPEAPADQAPATEAAPATDAPTPEAPADQAPAETNNEAA
jgi:hypothetical protein